MNPVIKKLRIRVATALHGEHVAKYMVIAGSGLLLAAIFGNFDGRFGFTWPPDMNIALTASLGLIGAGLGLLSYYLGQNAKRFNFMAAHADLFILREDVLRDGASTAFLTWRAKHTANRAAETCRAAQTPQQRAFLEDVGHLFSFLVIRWKLMDPKTRGAPPGSQTLRGAPVSFENFAHVMTCAQTAFGFPDVGSKDQSDFVRNLHDILPEGFPGQDDPPADFVARVEAACKRTQWINRAALANGVPEDLESAIENQKLPDAISAYGAEVDFEVLATLYRRERGAGSES